MKLPFNIKLPKFGRGGDAGGDQDGDDEEPAPGGSEDKAAADDTPEDDASEESESEATAAEDADWEDGAPAPSAIANRKFLIIAGVASVLTIGLAGGAVWWFKGGEKASGELQSKYPGPRVVVNVPPVGGQPGGMLTPPGDAAGTPSLNELAASIERPGTGVSVASVTPAAYAAIPEVSGETPLGLAPDQALLEQGEHGPMPRVSEDGRRPWQVYARPFDARDDRPRIAIIVTGLGLSHAATEAAIKRLPGSVTLAFSPYAKGLDDWVPLARAAGHEVLLSLPMDSERFPVEDTGPYALKTDVEPAANIDRLAFLLSRLSGYVGVLSVRGSKFTTAEAHLRPVLEALQVRGLMYVDDGATALTLAPGMATEIGLPRVLNDMILDKTPSRSAIDLQLAELETIVRKRAVAVAIARPYPATLERIAAWSASLEGKNMILAPISALADKQFLRR